MLKLEDFIACPTLYKYADSEGQYYVITSQVHYQEQCGNLNLGETRQIIHQLKAFDKCYPKLRLLNLSGSVKSYGKGKL